MIIGPWVVLRQAWKSRSAGQILVHNGIGLGEIGGHHYLASPRAPSP